MSPEPATPFVPPAGQTPAGAVPGTETGAVPGAEPRRRRRWAARCGAAVLAVTVAVTGVVPATQAAVPNRPPVQQVSDSSGVRPAHSFGHRGETAAGIRIPAPYRQVVAAPADGVEPGDPGPAGVGTAAV